MLWVMLVLAFIYLILVYIRLVVVSGCSPLTVETFLVALCIPFVIFIGSILLPEFICSSIIEEYFTQRKVDIEAKKKYEKELRDSNIRM